MSNSKTKPCSSCGHQLELDAAFCSACGKAQEQPAPSDSAAHLSFELDDAPEPAPRKPKPEPTPQPPAPAAEPGADDEPHVIELEDLEAEAPKTPPRADILKQTDEGGGDTVRMPLADVVKAWTEDASEEEPPAVDAAAPTPVPSGLPKKPIAILVGIVILIVLAIVLL